MNMKDLQAGRAQGLELALRIVKADGIEALEKEVRVRGRTRVNTSVNLKDLNLAVQPIKELCMETFSVLIIDTLHVHLGFGPARANRFMDAFWLKADCIMEDFASWQDYVDAIRDEMGIILELPAMEDEGYIRKAQEKKEQKRLKRLKKRSKE